MGVKIMRLLKAFLVGATGLFIVITLFSLLIPSRVRVSRAVLIDGTSAAAVRAQIANFPNWTNWHPIFTSDSATGSWQTNGSANAETSYRIAHGNQNILLTPQPSDSIATRFLLHAAGENEVENEIVVLPLPAQQAVQVEWRAITKLSWYPWQKFYGIFIDQLTGPGYETALNSLKTFLEQTPVAAQ